MIVHLFPSEKFTKSFICTVNQMFSESLNHFFVYNYTEAVEEKYELKKIEGENVSFIRNLREVRSELKYAEMFNNADKIIVHSLFYWKELVSYPALWRKKICIVFWGGDLQQLAIKPKTSFLRTVRYNIEKRKMLGLIEDSYAVATLLNGDCDLLSTCINLEKKKTYTAMYLTSEYTPESIYQKFSKSNDDKPWYILVGNNAADTNQHIEVFKALKNIDYKDIRVVVPLSYPVSKDTTYIDEVINVGDRMFGESFIPLTSYMKFEEYINVLSKCKIAIFNNTRQQALGNIELMTLLGGKVFIREDNVMWDEFVIKEKMNLYPFKSIATSNLNELVEYDEKTKRKNIDLMCHYMSKDRFLSIWSYIFEDK